MYNHQSESVQENGFLGAIMEMNRRRTLNFTLVGVWIIYNYTLLPAMVIKEVLARVFVWLPVYCGH